jgi:hypothetical protein
MDAIADNLHSENRSRMLVVNVNAVPSGIIKVVSANQDRVGLIRNIDAMTVPRAESPADVADVIECIIEDLKPTTAGQTDALANVHERVIRNGNVVVRIECGSGSRHAGTVSPREYKPVDGDPVGALTVEFEMPIRSGSRIRAGTHGRTAE